MKKQFSAQFKESSVEFAMSNGQKSLQELAKELGIGYSTLERWVREHKQANGLERKLSTEQQRINELEKEVAYLREVNEVIKKAHQYFINNPCR